MGRSLILKSRRWRARSRQRDHRSPVNAALIGSSSVVESPWVEDYFGNGILHRKYWIVELTGTQLKSWTYSAPSAGVLTSFIIQKLVPGQTYRVFKGAALLGSIIAGPEGADCLSRFSGTGPDLLFGKSLMSELARIRGAVADCMLELENRLLQLGSRDKDGLIEPRLSHRVIPLPGSRCQFPNCKTLRRAHKLLLRCAAALGTSRFEMPLAPGW